MEPNTERRTHQPKLPNGKLNLPEDLEAMSAVRLAQSMEDALEHMTEETYDETVISAYLDELDKKAPMPEMPSTDDAWKTFRKRSKEASYVFGDPLPKRSTRFRRALRVSMIAAIMVVVLFGAMVVAQAAGVDVFGSVARWTEETFHFSISADNSTDTKWFDGQKELDAAGIDKDFLPTRIPDGYTLEDIQITELSGQTDVYAVFSNSDRSTFDILISIYRNPADIETQIFEKDDIQVQTHQVDDKTVYLFYNLGVMNAVCQYRNVIYSIAGDLSQESVLELIHSIGDD